MTGSYSKTTAIRNAMPSYCRVSRWSSSRDSQVRRPAMVRNSSVSSGHYPKKSTALPCGSTVYRAQVQMPRSPLLQGSFPGGPSSQRVCKSDEPTCRTPSLRHGQHLRRPRLTADTCSAAVACLGLSRCFQNEIRDRIGLRYERNVTRLDLDGSRAHALGHETLTPGCSGPRRRSR